MYEKRRNVVLALLFASASIPAYAADKVTVVPVQFKAGANSATLKGSFAGYESVQYTLSAREGQQMTVKISGSSNANFNIFPPGASPGSGAALGNGIVGSAWNGALPATGKYVVQVFQMRASARRNENVPYTISFEIQ